MYEWQARVDILQSQEILAIFLYLFCTFSLFSCMAFFVFRLSFLCFVVYIGVKFKCQLTKYIKYKNTIYILNIQQHTFFKTYLIILKCYFSAVLLCDNSLLSRAAKG